MTKQTEALKMAIEADDYDLAEVLNDPLTFYPLNFSTPKKANALLFALCQAGADEILRLRRALEEALEQPAQAPLTSLDAIFADEMFRLNRDIVPLPEHLIHEIAQRNYHHALGINPVAFTAAIEKAHGIGVKR